MHAPNPAKGVASSSKGRSTTDDFWKIQARQHDLLGGSTRGLKEWAISRDEEPRSGIAIRIAERAS